MKPLEMRNLTEGELSEKIDGFEEELFNLRFQSQMGQLSNPLRLRILRRDIARAKTLLREYAKNTQNKAAAKTAKAKA